MVSNVLPSYGAGERVEKTEPRFSGSKLSALAATSQS